MCNDFPLDIVIVFIKIYANEWLHVVIIEESKPL